MEFNEAIGNVDLEVVQPGLQNQPGKKKDKNIAGQPKNHLTNSAEELPAGIDEDIDNADIEEPTEEELDQQKNNERDAMNDDNYVPPKNKNDKKK